MDRLAGAISAAAMPCNARDAIKSIMSPARSPAAEATAKPTSPTRNSAPPEEVGGTPPEHQQPAERQGVAGHDPLRGVRRHAELRAERRQRDVDDAEVQDPDQLRGQDDPQGQPRQRAVSIASVLLRRGGGR